MSARDWQRANVEGTYACQYHIRIHSILGEYTILAHSIVIEVLHGHCRLGKEPIREAVDAGLRRALVIFDA